MGPRTELWGTPYLFKGQRRRVYVSHRNRLCSVGKIGYESLECIVMTPNEYVNLLSKTL